MAVQKPGLLDSDHVLTAADFNVCWNDVNTVTPQLGEIKQEVHSCGYCHGKTTNDMRGNCAACGGPRVQPVIPQATLYGKPITDKEAVEFIVGDSTFPMVLPW